LRRREWSERRGQETRHNNNITRAYYLPPEETAAIAAYCADNPLKGCPRLCREMADKNIAYVSAGSVYNVIKRHNPGKKRVEAMEMAKYRFEQPKAVHEQRRIDFSYMGSFRAVRIGNTNEKWQ
jgi:hypothetical protein